MRARVHFIPATLYLWNVCHREVILDAKILKFLRPNGRWSEFARKLYTARRLLAFFEKYPVLDQIALSDDPDNRVLWDGIYRHFFRSFPVRTDIYFEQGKEQKRAWWYNEEVYDPRWDVLMREYKAGSVYHQLVRPYLRYKSSGA